MKYCEYGHSSLFIFMFVAAPGNTDLKGRVSTVDLFIKVA